MAQFIKVAGTEGKVGGYLCRLPPLNENTAHIVICGHPLISMHWLWYQSRIIVICGHPLISMHWLWYQSRIIVICGHPLISMHWLWYQSTNIVICGHPLISMHWLLEYKYCYLWTSSDINALALRVQILLSVDIL